MELSIVILCKNNVAGLERTLQSVTNLDGEILVYDFGCTGESKETALKYGARIYKGQCENYEHIRFRASQLATYDWIFMLHAGEAADAELQNSLQHIDFNLKKQVYRIRFKNYLGNRWLQYGEWGRYAEIRLASREGVETDGEKIHEQIFHRQGILIRNIKGYILHRSVKNTGDFTQKVINDALLWAAKSHRNGKKASIIKRFFSPAADFISNYFFRLGFLDGWEGFVCAKMGAWYTFLKYARLRELNDTFKKQA